MQTKIDIVFVINIKSGIPDSAMPLYTCNKNNYFMK